MKPLWVCGWFPPVPFWDLQLFWSIIKSCELLVYCCIYSEQNDRENSVSWRIIIASKEWNMNTKQFANIIPTSLIFSWRKCEQSINDLIISGLPITNDAFWIQILWEIDGKKRHNTTSTSMWELLCSILIADQLRLICHAVFHWIKPELSSLVHFSGFSQLWYKLVFYFTVAEREYEMNTSVKQKSISQCCF